MITYVQAPATVTADSDGTYPLYVVVVYSDGDSPPVALRCQYPALTIDADFSFSPPFPNNEAIGFPLSLPASAAKGPFDYILSLRTQSGLESNQVKESVVVQ